MKEIETHELGKVCENGVLALQDISLSVEEGEEVQRQHQVRHALRIAHERVRVQRFRALSNLKGSSIAIAFPGEQDAALVCERSEPTCNRYVRTGGVM